jgi:hypothetical protein
MFAVADIVGMGTALMWEGPYRAVIPSKALVTAIPATTRAAKNMSTRTGGEENWRMTP